MKKILIIADGILAKHFLERVFKQKNFIHDYTVVSYKPNTVPKQLQDAENFQIYNFDPTSLEKLKLFMGENDFDRCMVVMDDEFDSVNAYNNIKSIYQELEIYVIDMWGFTNKHKEDNHLKIVDVRSIVTSRLMGFLPDSPVFADNIGVGKGEIMEVKVPVGSSFAYKKVGMVVQSKYKIPMIYRHNQYIVTNYNTTIFPNDSLLIVGEPSALRSVFSNIKKEHGQFPSPFGINIYILADMKNMNIEKLKKLLNVGKNLNEKLNNHKIYIRVINPTLSDLFEDIKQLNANDEYEVLIDYMNTDMKSVGNDINDHKIGLIITDNDFFEENKSDLYRLNIPVMTIGKFDLNDITKGVILASTNQATEESSIVFDVCEQFELDVYLYYFDQNTKDKEETINHYKSLSKLFNKDLYVIDDETQNPILSLEKESDFLQFVPFDEKILKRNLTSAFSKNLNELYYKLKDNYQIFIPTEYGLEQKTRN